MLLAEPADLVFALVQVATEEPGRPEKPEALTEDDMLRLEIVDRAEGE